MRLGQRLLKGCDNGGEVNQGRLLTLADSDFSKHICWTPGCTILSLGPSHQALLGSLCLWDWCGWRWKRPGVCTYKVCWHCNNILQQDPSKPLVCERNEEWGHLILFSKYQQCMRSSRADAVQLWACLRPKSPKPEARVRWVRWVRSFLAIQWLSLKEIRKGRYQQRAAGWGSRRSTFFVSLVLWCLVDSLRWRIEFCNEPLTISLLCLLHSLATSSNCVLSEYTKTNRSSCVPHRSTCFCVWSACLNLKFVDLEDFWGSTALLLLGTKRGSFGSKTLSRIAFVGIWNWLRWTWSVEDGIHVGEAMRGLISNHFKPHLFSIVFYACFRHNLSNCRSCIQSLRQCGTAQYSQTMWQYDNALKMLQFGVPFAEADAEFGHISATQARGHTPRRRANHTHIYIYCIYIHVLYIYIHNYIIYTCTCT